MSAVCTEKHSSSTNRNYPRPWWGCTGGCSSSSLPDLLNSRQIRSSLLSSWKDASAYTWIPSLHPALSLPLRKRCFLEIRVSTQGGAQEKTQPEVARETHYRTVPLSENKQTKKHANAGTGRRVMTRLPGHCPSVVSFTASCVCEIARRENP